MQTGSAKPQSSPAKLAFKLRKLDLTPFFGPRFLVFTLGEPVKWAGKIPRLALFVDKALDYAKRSPEAASRVAGWLRDIANGMDSVKGSLPQSVWDQLAPIRKKIDDFLTAKVGPQWKLEANHSAQQWANKLAKRGWTNQQIDEALVNGEQFVAKNLVNPANPATRFVHPVTGRSIVRDNVTGEIIHIGGDGYAY